MTAGCFSVQVSCLRTTWWKRTESSRSSSQQLLQLQAAGRFSLQVLAFDVCMLVMHGDATGETGKATIFRGLSFWMTGRTCLPDQELKRIIVEHGGCSELQCESIQLKVHPWSVATGPGVYEQYGFTHVTHIIADNLASGNQTWAELKKRSKRVNVVTSSWVTACVQEGRRHSTEPRHQG